MTFGPIQPTPTGNNLSTGRAGYHNNQNHPEGGQENPSIRKAILEYQLAIPKAGRKSRRHLLNILWHSICIQTRQDLPRRIPYPHDVQKHQKWSNSPLLPSRLAQLETNPCSTQQLECRSTSSIRNNRPHDVQHHLLAANLAPNTDNRRHDRMSATTQALHRYGCKSTIRPTHETRAPAKQWSRQTNVCGTTRYTRQTQMHANRNKMGFIRTTIYRRHDKSISNSTPCPAATHTLHQRQARRPIHSSKKEKRSRQKEKHWTICTANIPTSNTSLIYHNLPNNTVKFTTT